ncbi:MAG: hypothetical protein ABSG76_22805 [Xanthobacteraceae bacterium]
MRSFPFPRIIAAIAALHNPQDEPAAWEHAAVPVNSDDDAPQMRPTKLPYELDEAAIIDGATPMQLF